MITSGFIRFNNTSNIIVQGLYITTPGSLLTISINGATNYYAGVWFDDSDSCRLSQCFLKLTGQARYTQWVILSGNSNRNRVDHCEFGPNTVQGHYVWPYGTQTIAGVTVPADRTDWANGNGPYNPNMARYTQIDHNYFHDQAPGTGEIIVLGGMGATGDYQDTYSVVENNLLVNCDGDAEIIAIKTSSSTLRYNTVITSTGILSSRAGNKSSIYGNFILQGGKSGAGGIKIYEMDHKVYNNYIENCAEYPILVGGGDAYDGSTGTFDHAQVKRASMVNNTIVNCSRQVRIGHGSPLPPVDFIFANNLIYGSGATFSESLVPTGSSVYSGNIIYPYNLTKTGFTVTDPKLSTINGLMKLTSSSPAINASSLTYNTFVSEDMDGETRDSQKDVGADEYGTATSFPRMPLVPSKVGSGSLVTLTIPETPSNFSATVLSATQINFTWNDNSINEDYFIIEYSTNGTTWAQLAKVYAGTLTYTGSNLTASTNYEFRIYATNIIGNSGFSNIVNVTTGGALPSPWLSQDIGNPALTGGAVFSNGTFSLNGAGSDIWTTADQFQFMHQQVSTDFEMVAKVLSVQNTNTYAKAGVMVRESLDANAANTFMLVGPTRTSFQVRASAGSSTTATNGTGVAPMWLKLSRAGNTVTGYQSSDGTTWTQLGSPTALSGTALYVGLAVTSHNIAALCNTQFDNVTLLVPPPAPSGLAASPFSHTKINLSWTDNSATETGFRIEKSLNAGGSWSLLATLPANATAYQDTALSASTTYHYRVRSENQIGNSVFSNTAFATTKASSAYSSDRGENLLEYFQDRDYKQVRIKFSLQKACKVKANVYSITGSEMQSIYDGNLKAGEQYLTWDYSNFNSGIYVIKILTGTFAGTLKINITK